VTRSAAACAITASQAAAFRLRRQHLIRTEGRRVPAPALSDLVADTGGIQAQVMSAAELSIWTRRRTTTRAEIQSALWNTRELVRTSALRLTLHVIPSRDLAMYIAAMKPSAHRRLHYWQSKVGAAPEHVRQMIDIVVDSLGDGPRTQQELLAHAKTRVSRGMATWMAKAAVALRPAVIEGHIVYGPPRGPEVTFVRTDAWLGPQRAMDLGEARAALARRFLSAFGPATPHDFAKWTGFTTSDAREAFDAHPDALVPVSVDGAAAWARREDLRELSRSTLDPDAVTLLGAFDTLLLAHATKEHLVDARDYKRVYRPQGWISAVVLRGGQIIGVWTTRTEGRAIAVDVALFRRASAAVRAAIAGEVDAMRHFLGAATVVRFV